MTPFQNSRHPRPPSLRLWLSLALLCSQTIASPVVLPHEAPQLWQQDETAQHVLGDAPEPAAKPRRLRGKFLHITDFHPDEFYKVHSSTSSNAACHRGKGPAGTYGAETSDCDTPYSLVNATFDWIAENVRDKIDFVIWTGDSARHDSDEKIPRSPAQVYGSNQVLADKFVSLLDDPSGRGLSIPVVPTLGNNDILPHNVLLPGPNKLLKQYTDIWARFIPEEQRHAFEFGGWFYVEVIPNHLAVFSLNTLYFFDRNAGVDDCVNPTEPGYKQLEWLRVQLQFMRERGVKVLLMGHVPPARTGSKQLWDETCWQKYTLWLQQYRDVVIGAFYGHMNIDHFLLHDTHDINYKLIGVEDASDESGGDALARTSMDDELDMTSTTDYLQELRSGWSKLPKPATLVGEEDVEDEEEEIAGKKKSKKNKKNKNRPKLSRKWGERYQVSLVSPSIVPNYLPTMRIFEYDISGLEHVPVWTEGAGHVPVLPDDGSLYDDTQATGKKSKKGKKGKKGRKDKKKKKADPSPKPNPKLEMPQGPSKTAPFGPAYSVQPLSLLGYTQYFANLTHINNDMTTEEVDGAVDANKWREGKHSGKEPQTRPAKPHKFEYKVEYSTFKDKIYNLPDLTVNSFLEMGYRMGQKGGKTDVAVVDEEDSDKEEEEDVVAEKKGKKDKKKKKKKAEQNKVWLHFLRHAFVTTVDEKKLQKTYS